MPKRVGNIYARMADPAFIHHCIRVGTMDSEKRRRRDVKKVLDHEDFYVDVMAEIVRERSFKPRPAHGRTVYDASSQKVRETNSVPFFPDGLMHIMVTQAMMDVLMRGMDPWSCASVPNRGGARVRKRLCSVMRRDPKGTRYAGEADVKSFYGSIPLRRLMTALAQKIKDKEFLLLVAIIITCEPLTLLEAEVMSLTWEDVVGDRRGLLIGFYVNQWLANFYLEPVDRLLNPSRGVKYHTRHMDNLVLLGPNKRKLHRAIEEVRAFLREELDLDVKDDWQIYRTTFTPAAERAHQNWDEAKRARCKPRMVAAVGYRFAHGKTMLRKRNFLRLTRQSRRIQKRLAAGRPISFSQAAGFLSRAGQLKHCDSLRARQKYVDVIGLGRLKDVVRIKSRLLLAAA